MLKLKPRRCANTPRRDQPATARLMSEILAEYGLIRVEDGRWVFPDGSVRVTPGGKPSVYDVVRVLGKQKSPHRVFQRFLDQNPDYTHALEEYKFLGRGQRVTPVLRSITDLPYLIEYTQLHTKSSRSGLSFYNKPKPLTERNLQAAIVEYLKECGEHPKEYVKCSYGVADIITERSVIEVKEVNGWKSALGQVIVYNKEFRLMPEIAIFGKGDFKSIMEVCTDLAVICCCYPSDSDLTEAMLINKGCWTYSNFEEVQHCIEVSSIAKYN